MSEHVPALARTRYTPYYLRSQGQANSLHGDGRLELTAPAEEPRIASSTTRTIRYLHVAAIH